MISRQQSQPQNESPLLQNHCRTSPQEPSFQWQRCNSLDLEKANTKFWKTQKHEDTDYKHDAAMLSNQSNLMWTLFSVS